MQLSLNFGDLSDANLDLAQFRRRLVSSFGSFGAGGGRLSPMDQLVKSLISSRTHDEDSQATYDRLKFRYPDWNDLADAPMEEVRDLLCPVTYADEKADWLSVTLKSIRRQTGALKLDFLGDWPVEQAHFWLTKLDGVGPKVAAAVLNFSRLQMRIMVVDTHVHRVARRYGLVPEKSTPEDAGRILMSLAPDAWRAEDFYELHWLMKRLGQLRCTHGWARCGACPVAATCQRRDLPERSNVARLHVRPR
jgi:endonuclease-3